MNKYQKSLNTISDTLTYFMVRRDESLVHSDNEIYDAMAVLRKFVDNTDTPDEAPVLKSFRRKSMNQLCSQKQLLIVKKL